MSLKNLNFCLQFRKQNKKLEDIIKQNEEQQAINLKMIEELTSIVTGMNGRQHSTPPMKTQDSKDTKESTSEEMDIEKESHKRKEPQTPRIKHRKTRATANSNLHRE